MLELIWYQRNKHFLSYFLLPFSFLFKHTMQTRRWLYRNGILKIPSINIPVIVVGNITIGGTGKTPFVMWLAEWLVAQGFKPGIVSRGYSGIKHTEPQRVNINDPAKKIGDEALLLAQCHCPVMVCIDRTKAVRALEEIGCNIVISDDGLQHYRLARDLEIAIVDGERALGNEYLLPAGPLREPKSRLMEVDFVVINGSQKEDEFNMQMQLHHLISMKNAQKVAVNDFIYRKVHAVAGIGNPQRFFKSLRLLGFEIIPHRFPDHYHYGAHDLQFDDDLPILMTEKDAVKCKEFANEMFWYLPVNVKISDNFTQKLKLRLEELSC